MIPLNDDEVNELQRIELPPKPARGGWQVNRTELLRAMDYLEIEFPVRIRYITAKRYPGAHYARSYPDPHHRVTIQQDFDIDEANRTLWHELIHCSQSERYVRRTGKRHNTFNREEYKAVDGHWGAKYEMNLYEIEARDRTEANKAWRLLY